MRTESLLKWASRQSASEVGPGHLPYLTPQGVRWGLRVTQGRVRRVDFNCSRRYLGQIMRAVKAGMPYLSKLCDEEKLARDEPARHRWGSHPRPIQPLCLRSQLPGKVPFTSGWLWRE